MSSIKISSNIQQEWKTGIQERLDAEIVCQLLENKKTVLSNPEWKCARVPDAYISVSFMGGTEIPVGVLLELWSMPHTLWVQHCPDCGELLYMISFAGSVMTGRQTCWGICTGCGQTIALRDKINLLKAFTDGMNLVQSYKEKYKLFLEQRHGIPGIFCDKHKCQTNFLEWSQSIPEKICNQEQKTEKSCSSLPTIFDVLRKSPFLYSQSSYLNTQKNEKEGIDIIGDIHGKNLLLHRLLAKLGYKIKHKTWWHPHRKALFLGDLIDRGEESANVAHTVRRMVEAENAYCLMGNHEFNAICWATSAHKNADGWLRQHTEKNFKQHKAFLHSVLDKNNQKNNNLINSGIVSQQHEELIRWFKTLPLWISIDGIQCVHACWSIEDMNALKPWLNDDATPKGDSLFIDASDHNSVAFSAVETLCKGKEKALPNDMNFKDKDGNLRRNVRIRWWLDKSAHPTWRELALLDEESMMNLPNTPVTDFSPSIPKLLTFVGHYWLNPQCPPAPMSPQVACLDYSAGVGGPLVAYRWNYGETYLNKSHFVAVSL